MLLSFDFACFTNTFYLCQMEQTYLEISPIITIIVIISSIYLSITFNNLSTFKSKSERVNLQFQLTLF